ncbi:MAG: hypothetical protein ACI9HK_002221 [Pirellulaceae bacterium]|jgi:hypothetical protein
MSKRSREIVPSFNRVFAAMSEAKKQPKHPDNPVGTLWSVRTRVIVSLLAVFHLTAVAIAPFHFATNTRPGVSSPASDVVIRIAKPYIDATFLNHGYFFFAPNPGPSHLVDYRVAVGQGSVEGRFPDRQQQWPRLLYHRHFMLSETINTNFVPATPPPSIVSDAVMLESWQRDRDIYLELRESFENRLRTKYAGTAVEMRRVEHRPPDWFEMFEQGFSLTDDRLYQVLADDQPVGPPNLGEANPPETPGNETPGNETPGNETPGNETPGNETPGNETPGNEKIESEGFGAGQGVLRPGVKP